MQIQGKTTNTNKTSGKEEKKSAGKEERKGGDDKFWAQTPEQIEEKDPNSAFRNEVAGHIREHWHITEPMRVQYLNLASKSCFHVKAPSCCPTDKQTVDGDYIVQVRVLEHMKEKKIIIPEEREMKHKRFADHLELMNLPCGSYISPGVITTERLQIQVHRKVSGKRLTLEQLQEKNVVSAVGAYLAKLHQGSRKFKVTNTRCNTEYQQHGFHWGTAPKDLPEDDQNYGILHGSFHSHNYMVNCEESKEASDIKVACYDFDDIRVGYFIEDVVYAVTHLIGRVGEDVTLRKQVLRWFVDAYVKQTQSFGLTDYKITNDHLRCFATPNLKDLLNDQHPKAKSSMKGHVERMKAFRAAQK